MPAATPSYVKNMIRRSLREIIDPGPTKKDEEMIWNYFDSKCAYCGKPLNKARNEGHIDHVLPSALDGTHNLSNRVLACATCNAQEKLDGFWVEFIYNKTDPQTAKTRIEKIHQWEKLNPKHAVDHATLAEVDSASTRLCAVYDREVARIRKLRKS